MDHKDRRRDSAQGGWRDHVAFRQKSLALAGEIVQVCLDRSCDVLGNFPVAGRRKLEMISVCAIFDFVPVACFVSLSFAVTIA